MRRTVVAFVVVLAVTLGAFAAFILAVQALQ